jgi:hypothetical protein
MYKNFLFKTLLVFIGLSIIYGMYIYFYYKRDISTHWIYGAYAKKELYAKSIKDHKIVFTGGSNVLMGITTKKIEEVLHIPCVNYGVHAGLRTSYIIYKTKQILKKGDIVVMPLEYSNINWDGSINDTLVGYILAKDKNYFDHLTWTRRIKMIYSITPYKIFKMYLSRIPSIKKKLLQSGYKLDSINKNGDETNNQGNKYKHYFTHIQLPKQNLLSLKGIEEIISFAKWCKNRGVSFYLTYPNILQIKDFNKKVYADYIDNLEKILLKYNVKVIGKPEEAFFKEEQMYDSKYHLNQKGNKIRTQYMLNLIERKVLVK